MLDFKEERRELDALMLASPTSGGHRIEHVDEDGGQDGHEC